MKNLNKMKIIVFTSILTVFVSLTTVAQVITDFEVGDQNIYEAGCWVFSDDDNSNNTLEAKVYKKGYLGGQYLIKTKKLKDDKIASVLSPWINVTAGNISYRTAIKKYKDDDDELAFLRVSLIDENGAITVLQTYEFVEADEKDEPNPPKTTNNPNSGIYKVLFEFYSEDLDEEAYLDDVSIPGTIVADPNDCSILQAAIDADGDNIADVDDDYPNDSTKASNNYTPSLNDFYTLAYEDLWPGQGDYDFNDLVVDYNFNEITNGDNEVVEIVATFYVRAVGGAYNNGFAIQFDNLTPSDIASVTGQSITGNLFNIAGNGTENGQSLAVIPVFDSHENVINRVGGSMYNTIPTNGTGISDTITLVITLNNPVASVGNAPYNPFLVANQQRGVEFI